MSVSSIAVAKPSERLSNMLYNAGRRRIALWLGSCLVVAAPTGPEQPGADPPSIRAILARGGRGPAPPSIRAILAGGDVARSSVPGARESHPDPPIGRGA